VCVFGCVASLIARDSFVTVTFVVEALSVCNALVRRDRETGAESDVNMQRPLRAFGAA
jgi:hypothetical protein